MDASLSTVSGFAVLVPPHAEMPLLPSRWELGHAGLYVEELLAKIPDVRAAFTEATHQMGSPDARPEARWRS